MKTWQKYLLAIAAFVTLVAAVGAVKGVHPATGNTGYLGSDLGGVYGRSSDVGVYGDSGNIGVYGGGIEFGVVGHGGHKMGGVGVSGIGVRGYSDDNGVGVKGTTWGENPDLNSVGVWAEAPNGGTALYAQSNAGWEAGYFVGDVAILGTLYKDAGAFRIDHPLDPANMYLAHSFVESPEMKNFYDGVVELDHRGEAVVELPEWFEALNNDYRYQLTCIGEHAPVYIADEIRERQFRIAGGYRGMKVSWLVTGVRHDAYAQARPIKVEQMKPEHERGRYLHPELYGRPRYEGVNAAREQLSRPYTPQ